MSRNTNKLDPTTLFIQDTGYWYMARDRQSGYAIGVLYVEEFPDEIEFVGVRIVGRSNVGFELITEAQAETYMHMELVPRLRKMDHQHISIKTVSSSEVHSVQVNYSHPDDDYDPSSQEARTIQVPPVLKVR